MSLYRLRLIFPTVLYFEHTNKYLEISQPTPSCQSQSRVQYNKVHNSMNFEPRVADQRHLSINCRLYYSGQFCASRSSRHSAEAEFHVNHRANTDHNDTTKIKSRDYAAMWFSARRN